MGQTFQKKVHLTWTFRDIGARIQFSSQLICHVLGMVPSQDASHLEDHYIFTRESLQTFIRHCFWVGGRSKSCCMLATKHQTDLHNVIFLKQNLIKHLNEEMILALDVLDS